MINLVVLYNKHLNRPIQAKCIASVTNYGLGLKELWCPLLIGDGIFSLMVNTGNLSANYFILHED